MLNCLKSGTYESDSIPVLTESHFREALQLDPRPSTFSHIAHANLTLSKVSSAQKSSLSAAFAHKKEDIASFLDYLTVQYFSHIGGLHYAIRQCITSVVIPALRPSLFSSLTQRLGASPPGGLLLYGPSGSGKTLLATATARFFVVELDLPPHFLIKSFIQTNACFC